MGFFDTNADVLDLRDVVAAGREYLETWQDKDTDPVEQDEALEALNELDKVHSDLGLGGKGYDGMLDALEEYADDEPTLIAADYFETYAQELADDVFGWGDEVRKALESWPYRHIDWAAAARDLEQDYNTVTLEGHDYLIRAV